MRYFGISSPTKLYLQLPISGYSNTAWKTSRVSVKLQSVFQKSPVKIYEALPLHNKTATFPVQLITQRKYFGEVYY